jgi:hypothetical protein
MMQSLTSLFGGLALLAIIAAGFTMMFAPALGKQLLKNTAIAVALFVLGSMLLSTFCSAHHL